MKRNSKLAFTMAEIIIAMTVIGVLAVITLPSLTSNIDDKNFATRRVALYSRLSQAVGVIDSLSDAGKYNAAGTALGDDTVAENAAMAFVLNKLSQGIKVESTCTMDKAENCGMKTTPNYYSRKGGTKFTLPTYFSAINSSYKYGANNNKELKGAIFTTKNGDSIALYYNPDCLSGIGNGASYKNMVCADFIYDLNGTRSPNMMGKDVGVGTILFATGSEVVMPSVIDYSAGGADGVSQSQAVTSCVNDNMILPSRNELISMSLNKNYLFKNDPSTDYYWSSTNVMKVEEGENVPYGWAVKLNDSTEMGKLNAKSSGGSTAHFYCSYPMANTK